MIYLRNIISHYTWSQIFYFFFIFFQLEFDLSEIHTEKLLKRFDGRLAQNVSDPLFVQHWSPSFLMIKSHTFNHARNSAYCEIW